MSTTGADEDRKAVREHECAYCLRTVAKGEWYWRKVAFSGPKGARVTTTRKVCKHCERIVGWYVEETGDTEFTPESVRSWLVDRDPVRAVDMERGWVHHQTKMPFEHSCVVCGAPVPWRQLWCDCHAVSRLRAGGA